MAKKTFKLYREYGALNSVSIFDAVSVGLKNVGFTEVGHNEDIPVIWSVLWLGRMQGNRQIYMDALKLKKPILIVEVGNLKRNVTWRISLNNINGQGEFGNLQNLDTNRSKLLNVELKDFNQTRDSKILIATQHENSLQWSGQAPLNQWLTQTINEIKRFSDRKIVVRPHPRWPLRTPPSGVILERPKKVVSSYDDYDINYNYHAVINHNSGPAVQAAVNGTPIICHSSSLAFPVSSEFSQIENLCPIDRSDWFLKLCHTEWTVDEISKGIPFERLKSKILID